VRRFDSSRGHSRTSSRTIPEVIDARLSHVTLRVRDVAASAAFYRDAFGVLLEPGRGAQPPDGGAQPTLALVSTQAEPTENVELSFFVEDVQAAHRRAVAAGAAVVHAPHEERGARAAVYRDRDGNLVTLTQRLRALRVAGVDLAGGGLAVVVVEGDRVVDAFRCDAFADALLVDAKVVAVDVPIGIPEEGERPADAAARRFVGPRASSVFTTPTREVLEAPSYEEARRVAREATGKSISAQSYALRRRILEVDEYAREDERVIEVHPEVSFRELARRPLISKHRTDGLAERRALLEDAGISLPASVPRIAEPDLLDATVAAWSASRYARGEALPLPPNPNARIGAIWR
jgi:predicted RNase H-like nuclease/predicted enzyme related to lactoylglutathione lyase